MKMRKQKRKPYYTLSSPGVSFSRSSSAYDEQGNFYNSGAPRIVPGQGLLIEEGTTNLISNPFLNVDSNADGVADGWSVFASGINQTMRIINGTQEMSGVATAAYGYCNIFRDITVTVGTTYSASFEVDVKSLSNSKVRCSLWFIDSGYVKLQENYFDITTTGKYTVKIENKTAPANTVWARVRVYIFDDGTGLGSCTVAINKTQLEAKPYATTFVNGTRGIDILQIPENVLRQEQGTLFFDFTILRHIDGNWRRLFDWGQGWATSNPPTSTDFHISRNPVNLKAIGMNIQQAGVGSVGTSVIFTNDITAGKKYRLASSWNFTGDANGFIKMSAFDVLAGEYKTSSADTNLLPALNSFIAMLGNNTTPSGIGCGNISFHQFAVYNRALSDAEVADLVAGKLVAPGNLRFAMKF